MQSKFGLKTILKISKITEEQIYMDKKQQGLKHKYTNEIYSFAIAIENMIYE